MAVINDSLNVNKYKAAATTALMSSEIDSLKKVIIKKQEQFDAIFEENQKLKKNNDERLIICKNQNSSKDSLIKYLQSLIKIKCDSIEKNIKEQDRLKSQLSDYKVKVRADSTKLFFADRCIGRFSNSRLYTAYDEKRINEAIESFAQIDNKYIKNEFKQVEELLKDYQLYNSAFLDILKEAQNDADRLNKFKEADFRANYMSKLDQMDYYQKYYKNKQINAELWSIPFLDKQISMAKELLKKHKKDGYADFSSIIFDCTH